jgi:hypothetical protein
MNRKVLLKRALIIALILGAWFLALLVIGAGSSSSAETSVSATSPNAGSLTPATQTVASSPGIGTHNPGDTRSGKTNN